MAPISFAALCSKPPPGTEELASVAGVFLTSLETVCVVPAAPDGRAASAWLRAVLSSPMEVLPFLPPEVLCRIARSGGLPQVPDGRVVVCMTREADMWALGMTAWAVVCGSGTPGGHPGRELQPAASPRFSGGSGLLATHFLAQARRGFEDHPLWGRLPLELRALLATTLVWEPERRATARQLLDGSALVARTPKPGGWSVRTKRTTTWGDLHTRTSPHASVHAQPLNPPSPSGSLAQSWALCPACGLPPPSSCWPGGPSSRCTPALTGRLARRRSSCPPLTGRLRTIGSSSWCAGVHALAGAAPYQGNRCHQLAPPRLPTALPLPPSPLPLRRR